MDSTIKKLFDSRDRKFEIPSYQRAYAWDTAQINQLIEDLETCGKQYYLGHFLFEKNEDSNTLYVIDGQQRLTTCVIFFSAIKKELEKRTGDGIDLKSDIKNIGHYYLKDLLDETQRFTTIQDDNNFFLDEIVNGIVNNNHTFDTQSQKKIRSAREIFENKFLDLSTQNLLNWYQLVENSTITQYIVKDKIQAAQIFAFQNDRGKDLSKIEIIKAYFMLQIYLSSNSKEKIEENIKYLENEISQIYRQVERIKINEDEVLNYYWRAVNGKGFHREDAIKGIKEKIGSINGEEKTVWIKEFICGLSNAFKTIEKTEKSTNSYAQDLLYLNKMAFSYPFIIKACQYNADEQTLNRLIKFLENITFRHLLRSGRAEIESRLNNHLIHFNSAADIDIIINKIIGDLKTGDNEWWYWGDKELDNGLNRWFYQNSVDNYLLWKYELFISNKNHPAPHNVSFHKLIRDENIEHIAPKIPKEGDPIAHGYGSYDDKNSPENGIVSGNWLNRLGNLMLISKSHNCSIGNKPFDEKLESYGRDNLLNQQKEIIEFVADKSHPIWDKQAIEKRQIKITEAVKKIWNLDSI